MGDLSSTDLSSKVTPEIRNLVRKIRENKVILFLGSGINRGSFNSDGKDAPLGNELAKLIQDRILP